MPACFFNTLCGFFFLKLKATVILLKKTQIVNYDSNIGQNVMEHDQRLSIQSINKLMKSEYIYIKFIYLFK